MGLLAMLLIACAEESGEGPQTIVKTVVQTVEVGGERPATGGTTISTPAAEELKAVGETDTAGPLDVTLNGVRWASYEAEATTPGDYVQGSGMVPVILVDMTLTNVGNGTADFNYVSDGRLYDSQGYSYEYDATMDQRPPPEGPIAPGQSVSGEAVWDLEGYNGGSLYLEVMPGYMMPGDSVTTAMYNLPEPPPPSELPYR